MLFSDIIALVWNVGCIVDLDCEAVLKVYGAAENAILRDVRISMDVDVDITWDVYIGSSTWVTCDIDIAREGARDLSHFRKARGLGV